MCAPGLEPLDQTILQSDAWKRDLAVLASTHGSVLKCVFGRESEHVVIPVCMQPSFLNKRAAQFRVPLHF